MAAPLQAVNNFDFLARSFADMYASGRHIDIQAITGNMTAEQRKLFMERYAYYRAETAAEPQTVSGH